MFFFTDSSLSCIFYITFAIEIHSSRIIVIKINNSLIDMLLWKVFKDTVVNRWLNRVLRIMNQELNYKMTWSWVCGLVEGVCIMDPIIWSKGSSEIRTLVLERECPRDSTCVPEILLVVELSLQICIYLKFNLAWITSFEKELSFCHKLSFSKPFCNLMV